MRLRLAASAVLVLLAVSASAQPAGLEGRGLYGAYGAYGTASPERLLFPYSADPDLSVGVRVSERLDVQVGIQWDETDRTWLSQRELAATREVLRTGAVVLGAGYADRLGVAVLRGRLSLGYDDYSRVTTAFGPDSVEVWDRWDDVPTPGVALRSRGTQAVLGKYVHAGLSTSAGVPVRLGVTTVEPTVGVAATLSGRTSGSLDAPGPQAMPYVRLPITARVLGAAFTFDTTFGVAFGPRTARGLGEPDRAIGTKPGAIVGSGALRVDL